MNNAVWLLLALPSWYFEAATDPFGTGALTLVPAIGSVSLLVGVVLGAIKRRRELLWFLSLFASSEGLVAVAGLFRGSVPYSGSAELSAVLLIFIVIQSVVCGYLIYRLKGARTSATALSIFSVTYALASTFVAGMSFGDVWL